MEENNDRTANSGEMEGDSMRDSVIVEVLEMARMKENQEQRMIEEIYILNDRVYFSRYDLKGKEPDFTLVRHNDEMSTIKKISRENRILGGKDNA